MSICQNNAAVQPTTDTQQEFDWTQAAQLCPNVEEAPQNLG